MNIIPQREGKKSFPDLVNSYEFSCWPFLGSSSLLNWQSFSMNEIQEAVFSWTPSFREPYKEE